MTVILHRLADPVLDTLADLRVLAPLAKLHV